MKPMICFLLLALGACGGQQKTESPLTAKTDTVQVKEPGKEPITLERETGKPVYDMIEGDTVYRYADSGPEFSIPKPYGSEYSTGLEHYIQEAVKDIHIGEGVSVVCFVVNKMGLPCHISIASSAKVFVSDARSYRQMDSIACEVVRDLPYFIPASLNGELVNYLIGVAVRFK
jgi:hypothetical protein